MRLRRIKIRVKNSVTIRIKYVRYNNNIFLFFVRRCIDELCNISFFFYLLYIDRFVREAVKIIRETSRGMRVYRKKNHTISGQKGWIHYKNIIIYSYIKKKNYIYIAVYRFYTPPGAFAQNPEYIFLNHWIILW